MKTTCGAASSHLAIQFVIKRLLGGTVEKLNTKVNFVIGWGAKKNTRNGRLFAKKIGVPFLALEDGFLRSYYPGIEFPSLTLVVDKRGIYYDSNYPSDLENLLNEYENLFINLKNNTFDCYIGLVLKNHLSKYNYISYIKKKISYDYKNILVIDQTKDDMSVLLGNAYEGAFSNMLNSAKHENPTANIYIKTHPEVTSGRKNGYLTHIQDSDRIVMI